MKKLFTNDIFFAMTTWFSALVTVLYVIGVSIYYNDKSILLDNCLRAMTAICLVVTYISYKKHSKNVMKGMMGAVLILIVMITVNALFVSPDNIIYYIGAIILSVAIFINHFIINSDHYARPVNIVLNQVLTALFAVASIVTYVAMIPTCINVIDTIVTVLMAIAQPCCMLSIVCIESRLDAYRKDREAAGWTEEAGYPEGYVHEYEKK